MDSDRIQVNHFVEAFDSFYDWDGNQAVNLLKENSVKPFEFDIELNSIF